MTLRKPLEYRLITSCSVLLASFLVALLSFSILTPVQTSSADTLDVTIDSTDYTLSLTSSDVAINMDALPGGSLAVASDTVNVKTNNPAGYRLYLSTDSTADTSKNLYLNGTVAETTPKITATTGSFLNPTVLSDNTWGYAMSRSDANTLSSAMSWTPITNFAEAYSPTASQTDQSAYTWAGIPTKTNPQLIQKTTSANNTTGVDATVYFGVKANASLSTGTYSGTILYTALPDGTMTDTASISPNEVDEGSTESVTITTSLHANASGVENPTVTIGGSACAITALSNNDTGVLEITCTAPALSAGSYDVVVDIPNYGKSYTITSGITYIQTTPYIQDFTPAQCSELASSSDLTVIDRRDDNEYTVRYINGNCWMTQNLRFIGKTGDASGTMTVESSTSNATSTTTISYGDLTSGDSDDEARIHNSGDTTTGVWYNYAAASAMTVKGSSNSTNATQDICPKNWRLPTNSEQSGITSYSSAYGPVTGGYYNGGSLYDTGFGGWWSATASNSTGRYDLRYDGSSLGTGSNYRYRGFYVRCILNDTRTISDMTYMQDVTSTIVNNTAEGATATLTDIRDNKTYTVRKINGNLWMTQNLRFTGTSLKTTDSNVTSNVTISKYYDLATNGTSSSTGECYSSNGYNNPCIKNSGKTTTGVWYNYAAATAMTVTGSSNSTNAAQDICPKNWRLPTYSEQSGITSYSSAYSPVTGGAYYGGSLVNTGRGLWWSATANGSAYRYSLYYDGSSLGTNGGYDRYRGFYVRCMRSS